MGKFLDSVSGQQGPAPAADKPPVLGGDALDMHEAKRRALFSDEILPRINGSAKFSTGPRSSFTNIPTKTNNTRRAP